MLIKQTRVNRNQGKHAVAHVMKTEGNELSETIEGDFEQLEALAEARAQTYGRKYALRHVVFAPDEELTPQQEQRMFERFLEEFGADRENFAVQKHIKERDDGNKSPHYHMLISEVQNNGKVLNAEKFKMRNEKVARELEIEFGHELTKGRFNRYVMDDLLYRGFDEEAEKMRPLTEGKLPKSAYDNNHMRAAEKVGLNIKELKEQFKTCRGDPTYLLAKKVAKVCAENNLTVEKGDKKNVIVIKTKDGKLVGSLSRLADIEARSIPETLKAIGIEFPKAQAAAERKRERERAAKNDTATDPAPVQSIGETNSKDDSGPDRPRSEKEPGKNRESSNSGLRSGGSTGTSQAGLGAERTDSRANIGGNAGSSPPPGRETSPHRGQVERAAGNIQTGIRQLRTGKLQKAASANGFAMDALRMAASPAPPTDWPDISKMTAEQFLQAWARNMEQQNRGPRM